MDNKYEIVKKGLWRAISEGDYEIGAKLPTEATLMTEYGVSRYTVRRAISDLEQEHYIYSIQGGGTYVADWKKAQRDAKAANQAHKLIGVITTRLADYIFPNIISGIDRVISDAGYSLMISDTHNNHEHERHSLQNMLDIGVQGLIIEPTLSGTKNPNMDLYDQISAAGIPVVFINSHYEDFEAPYLAVDDVKSEEMLVNYLINKGHTNILGVFKVDDVQGVDRMRGFTQATQQSVDAMAESSLIMYQAVADGKAEQLLAKIERHLDGPDRPTAIALYNDALAVRTIDLVRSHDLRIPEDISIVGFDDYILDEYLEPSLTTMIHPKERMGHNAADMLIQMMNGEQVINKIYEPQLVERGSVADISE
jgi:GntR family transcriptional regulator of arabinose operon